MLKRSKRCRFARNMRKIIGIVFFSVGVLIGQSQRKGFIYLEASNRQPFYVLHVGQVYSSSSNGYLLISPVERDTFDCIIGFPKERWKRKRYRVPVVGQDCYWQWMQVDSGSWALYDRMESRWVREEAEKIQGLESNESDVMTMDALSDWLEQPVKKDSSAVKKKEKTESKNNRGMNLEQGWLMRYADADDSVWVWLPKEEGRMMRRELGEEKRWKKWVEESMRERDWESELKRVSPGTGKRNKQESGWKE